MSSCCTCVINGCSQRGPFSNPLLLSSRIHDPFCQMSQTCWSSVRLLLPFALLTVGFAAFVPQEPLQPVPRHFHEAGTEPPGPALEVSAVRPMNGSERPAGVLEEVLNAVEQEGVRLAGFDFEDVEIPLIIAIFFFGVGILKISALYFVINFTIIGTRIIVYKSKFFYCFPIMFVTLITLFNCSVPEMVLHQPLHPRIVVSRLVANERICINFYNDINT